MDVKVYSTSTCHYCKMVKDHLTTKGIPYQDIDVGNNSDMADEMVKISGQMGVPVVSIDGKIVVGFDKEKIDSLL